MKQFYNLHKVLVYLASCALLLMKDDAISEATDEENLSLRAENSVPGSNSLASKMESET